VWLRVYQCVCVCVATEQCVCVCVTTEQCVSVRLQSSVCVCVTTEQCVCVCVCVCVCMSVKEGLNIQYTYSTDRQILLSSSKATGELIDMHRHTHTHTHTQKDSVNSAKRPAMGWMRWGYLCETSINTHPKNIHCRICV